MKKECSCKKWQTIVGDEFSKNTNPFNSKGSSTPMYFGKIIIFCPWCGRHLTPAVPDSEGGINEICPVCGKRWGIFHCCGGWPVS